MILCVNKDELLGADYDTVRYFILCYFIFIRAPFILKLPIVVVVVFRTNLLTLFDPRDWIVLQAASVLKKSEGILTIVVCNPKSAPAATSPAATAKKDEAKPSMIIFFISVSCSLSQMTVCLCGLDFGFYW
jgi:hypothetical protein